MSIRPRNNAGSLAGDVSRDLTVLDAGGVDEVSVVPWSLLLRQKIVQTVGV